MTDQNIGLFAINAFVLALCGGLYVVLPYLTRKSLLFGVKVPPEAYYDPAAQELRKSYVRTCLLGTLVLLLICAAQFMLWREWTMAAAMYLPLLVIPLYFIAFVPNWKRAAHLKAERGWQVPSVVFAETSSSHTRGKLSNVPWGWYIAGLVLVLATFAVAVIQYPHLPDMIAAHMDGSMQPTRMVPKTWGSVLMMPLMNAGLLVVLMLPVGIMIERAKLQIDPSAPRKSFAQHRAYRRRMGNAMGFLTLSMVLLLALVGLPILFPVSPALGGVIFWIGMGVFSISMVVLIAVILKTGQGGCKVKVDVDESAAEDEAPAAKSKTYGRGDDKYWIIGTFYYNPDDPAYIVEDRFGTNIGFNYAKRLVQLGTVLLALGLVATYVWITMQLL
ncbi:MAG: DUF1648 domain-containing protein [Oscillospiraceae bacterium]|nr:DUF1648 domain-containing protein [Oscillospiraceae bacterium]